MNWNSWGLAAFVGMFGMAYFFADLNFYFTFDTLVGIFAMLFAVFFVSLMLDDTPSSGELGGDTGAWGDGGGRDSGGGDGD